MRELVDALVTFVMGFTVLAADRILPENIDCSSVIQAWAKLVPAMPYLLLPVQRHQLPVQLLWQLQEHLLPAASPGLNAVPACLPRLR